MWVLDIPAEDIKTKRPIEYPISAELYLLHWPNGVTNLSSVVTAFENLRSAGKIRAWGVSNLWHRYEHDVSEGDRICDCPTFC